MNDTLTVPTPQTEAEAEAELDRLLQEARRILRDMDERQLRIDRLREETQAKLAALKAFQFSR